MDTNATSNTAILAGIGQAAANTIGTEYKYVFKSKKDEAGKPTSLTLVLPFLTVTSLQAILAKGGKGLDMLLDAANTEIVRAARLQTASKEVFTQADLNLTELGWEYLANVPKADRVGNGIPADTFAAFLVDYKAVIVPAAGITPEKADAAVKLFSDRLNKVRTAVDVLDKLNTYLDLYIASTPNGEQFLSVYEYFIGKIAEFKTVGTKALLDNL